MLTFLLDFFNVMYYNKGQKGLDRKNKFKHKTYVLLINNYVIIKLNTKYIQICLTNCC